MVVSFQDIGHAGPPNSREQMEAQLRQAEKLGAAGKLVGGIAHDFNNRLAIIMGYGDLLCSGLTSDDPCTTTPPW
jgi:signal transduction histidine kinase